MATGSSVRADTEIVVDPNISRDFFVLDISESLLGVACDVLLGLFPGRGF